MKLRIPTRKRTKALTAIACATTCLLLVLTYRSGAQAHVVAAAGDAAAATDRAPEQVSCTQVLHSFGPDPNKGKIFKRQTVTQPPFVISLHNEAYDRVRWSIMKYGKYYEAGLTEHFKQILGGRSTSLVVDVGLNIGWFSLWALALGHNVVAFEPNSANILRVCQSVDLNQFETNSIQIFRLGLGDTPGEMKLSWMGANPGSAQVQTSNVFEAEQSKRSDEKRRIRSQNAQTVRVMKLDEIADTQGWFAIKQNISILKVDVEGYESHVFNGALRLLHSGQVENLLMEFASDKSRRAAAAAKIETIRVAEIMMNQIMESGFKLHDIGNGMGRPVPGALEQVSSAVETRDAQALVSKLYEVCPKRGRHGDCQMNLWWKRV